MIKPYSHIELLSQLTQACSVSGFEIQTRDILFDSFLNTTDFCDPDNMGSIAAAILKRDPASTLGNLKTLVSSRLDTKHSFYISEKTKDSKTLKLKTNYNKFLTNTEAKLFIDQDTTITGNIKSDLFSYIFNTPEYNRKIRIGNPIQFLGSPVKQQENIIQGQGISDKIGLVCLVDLAERLYKSNKLGCRLHLLAHAKSHINGAGVLTAVQKIKPFIFIEVDTKLVTSNQLGSGIYIEFTPITNPVLSQFMKASAKSLKIKCKYETDWDSSDLLSKVSCIGDGPIVGRIKIPVYNSKTPDNIVHTDDLNAAHRLLYKVCTSVHLIPDFIPIA